MCFFRILKSKWQKNLKCFLYQKLRRRGSLYVINYYICNSVIKKVKNADILQNMNMGEKWGKTASWPGYWNTLALLTSQWFEKNQWRAWFLEEEAWNNIRWTHDVEDTLSMRVPMAGGLATSCLFCGPWCNWLKGYWRLDDWLHCTLHFPICAQPLNGAPKTRQVVIQRDLWKKYTCEPDIAIWKWTDDLINTARV